MKLLLANSIAQHFFLMNFVVLYNKTRQTYCIFIFRFVHLSKFIYLDIFGKILDLLQITVASKH